MKRTFLIVVSLASVAFAQIDPRIPMPVKPPQIDNPLDTYRRVMEIKNQQAEIELRRAETERIRAETEAARQRVASPGGQASHPVEQSPGEMRTYGLLNCRAWNNSAAQIRLAYLNGGMELLSVFAVDSISDNPQKANALVKDYMPFSLELGEISSAVTRFCAQAENSRIVVVDALKLVTARTAGLPPDEFEARTAIARKVAAASPDPKQP